MGWVWMMGVSEPLSNVGVVAIGRNEGERLRRCLDSVVGTVESIVYVDSGSTDASVGLAESVGAEVVLLDTEKPFTAARARNVGLQRLLKLAPELPFVQFLDGDCEMFGTWLTVAVRALSNHADVAVVCGRRREKHPDDSIYNRIMDMEWDTPVGDALACGGDAVMRVSALRQVGGFDDSIAAGEEPELCTRLRGKGWRVLRLDADMTLHDAALTAFRQWWMRQIRSGYGALDVVTRCGGEVFGAEVRSAWVWGPAWGTAVLGLAGLGWLGLGWFGGLATLLAVLAWPAQVVRVAAHNCHRSGGWRYALPYAGLTMISKWAQVWGHCQFWCDRHSGKIARMIEYKGCAS